jgi:hypothetical protein
MKGSASPTSRGDKLLLVDAQPFGPRRHRALDPLTAERQYPRRTSPGLVDLDHRAAVRQRLAHADHLRRVGDHQRHRVHQQLLVGFVVKRLIVRAAEHGDVGDRIDEHALGAARGRGPKRSEQVPVRALFQVGAGVRWREERQAVRGCDDDPLTRLVLPAVLDHEPAPLADPDDGLGRDGSMLFEKFHDGTSCPSSCRRCIASRGRDTYCGQPSLDPVWRRIQPRSLNLLCVLLAFSQPARVASAPTTTRILHIHKLRNCWWSFGTTTIAKPQWKSTQAILGIHGMGTLESELAPLLDFDFLTYSELVDDRGGERRLNVVLPSGPITILFNAYDGIADILDQLPTVNVRLDNSSDDGPASGSLCVFFIADGVSETELKVSVSALAETLKSDFNSLEKTAQGSTTLA